MIKPHVTIGIFGPMLLTLTSVRSSQPETGGDDGLNGPTFAPDSIIHCCFLSRSTVVLVT